ncbi:MAG: diguanylate cyclase (GGDEF)-like protein [Motiliproteus sp.]|jgi:diguanylate cyclase (GGDEF)-like protein
MSYQKSYIQRLLGVIHTRIVASLSCKILVYFSILGTLLITMVTTLWQLSQASEQLSEIHKRRFESYKLAEELRRSSDELTRMVRTYVVTGDERFKNYFDTIIGIRDGLSPRPANYQGIYWDSIAASRAVRSVPERKVSIIELMEEQGFASAEMALLAKAKVHSDQLIDMEKQAIDALTGTPENPTTAPRYARQLLHGEQYHQFKADIMADIDRFFTHLDQRTSGEVSGIESARLRLLNVVLVLAGSLISVTITGYLLMRKTVIRPLERILCWIKRVEAGDYRIQDSVQQTDEIGLLAKKFAHMADTVAAQIGLLKIASQTDSLTQLNNRIGLNRALQQEEGRFERYHTPCTLLLLDIDLFKVINDQQGHLIGDQVLIAVARIIEQSIRKTDVVGRWGGEEFLVICPDTDVENGRVVAEKIRACIMEHTYTKDVRITVSCGVAPLMQGETTDATLERADRALYQAKRDGRNRVCCYPSALPLGRHTSSQPR